MTKSRSHVDDESGSHRPVQATLVNDSGLKSLRARPKLRDYLKQLWAIRHFILADARGKSFSEGRGTFLGAAWIVFNPAIQVGLYAFIFGVLIKTNRGIDNFIGFLIIGVIFFSFLSTGLSLGSMLIQRNRNLITSFSFPKAAVVISAGLRVTLDNLAPACLAIVAALAFQYSKPLSWTIVLAIPLYVLMHLFITGLSLVTARLTAMVPDFNAIIGVISRILFFTSGVFWPISRYVHDPMMEKILESNPFFQFLHLFRVVVLDGDVPSLGSWAYIGAWSILILVFGLIFFWRAEHRYAAIK